MMRVLDVLPAVALLDPISGDPMGLPDDNPIGACYELDPSARITQIQFAAQGDTMIALIDDDAPSEIDLIARLEFTSAVGPIEAILILETPFDGLPRLWLAPIGPMGPLPAQMTLSAQSTHKVSNALYARYAVGIEAAAPVLMADGRAQPLHDVKLGDRLLTRDHGPQDVMWLRKVSTPNADLLCKIPKQAAHNTEALCLGRHTNIIQYPHWPRPAEGFGTTLPEPCDTVLIACAAPEAIFVHGLAVETLFCDRGMSQYLSETYGTQPPRHDEAKR